MIRVYHLNRLTTEERDRLDGPGGGWSSEPRFDRYATITTGFNPGMLDAVREAWRLGEYTLIAEVETESPEVAWTRTCQIEHDWREREGVTYFDAKPRSTTVGDVIGTDKRFYVIMPFSYEEIELVYFQSDTIDGALGAGVREAS